MLIVFIFFTLLFVGEAGTISKIFHKKSPDFKQDDACIANVNGTQRTFYFMRHGESLWNQDQGKNLFSKVGSFFSSKTGEKYCDSPLSPKGKVMGKPTLIQKNNSNCFA